MSASRLEEALTTIGPVMGQLFGQSEAPMMISTLAPAEHFRDDGSLARERLSSAGRPTPLTTVAVMDDEGHLLGPGAARRDRGPRIAGHGRLLHEPGGHGGRRPERLAPHRGHRLPRPGRLPVYRRPRQGHDHHRRIQRLLGRGGAGPAGPSRRAGLRGHRAARREMGRARHRGRATPPRPDGDRGGGPCPRQGTAGQREGPQAGRGLARPAPVQGRGRSSRSRSRRSSARGPAPSLGTSSFSPAVVVSRGPGAPHPTAPRSRPSRAGGLRPARAEAARARWSSASRPCRDPPGSR